VISYATGKASLASGSDFLDEFAKLWFCTKLLHHNEFSISQTYTNIKHIDKKKALIFSTCNTCPAVSTSKPWQLLESRKLGDGNAEKEA